MLCQIFGSQAERLGRIRLRTPSRERMRAVNSRPSADPRAGTKVRQRSPVKGNWPHEPAYVSDLRHLALQYKTERNSQ
jgi:hypothetical protein